MEEITYFDNEQGYQFDGLVNQIENSKLDLSENENFKQTAFKNIKRLFSRENNLKFGIMTGEIQVKIEEVNGSVALSTVDRQQIQKRIKTFPEKDQKKVKYVHISTCQILIKSTFIQGIDSPLTLILRDNRFMDREKSIIAQGNGNLRMGKIKFDVNLQIGLSLQTI
uniref:Movement protein n=1 Tax=Cajanus cajan TaxID=3821 RepID=A0A151TYR4_CAJCA|nr:Movement protein [Cajanus cajan]